MKLHVETPLVESSALSKLLSTHVYLKLDSAQQTGSFKIRGIGHICVKAVQERGVSRFVSSSGGNAGIAVAYAARKLEVPCTVVVPTTTNPFLRAKIELEGSNVLVHGNAWHEAHQKATELATSPNTELIHPFDHEEIWEGHTSLITECASQLQHPPDVVITVAGGGGLLVGIVRGLKRVGWGDVPVLVSETEGAASLAAAMQAGTLVTLPVINTIARTLGAATVTKEALEVTKTHKVVSCVVTDRDAVAAILALQSDHQVLVEPSCGAGLALLYNPDLYNKYVAPLSPKSILVIVCGGNGVTIDMLQEWKDQFDL